VCLQSRKRYFAEILFRHHFGGMSDTNLAPTLPPAPPMPAPPSAVPAPPPAQTAKLSDADYQKLTYPERIAYAAKFSQRSVQAPATPTAAEWAAMSPQARADFDRARSDALAKGYTAGGVGVDVEDAMNLRPRLDTLELRLSYLFGL
jgi:hypothetical protein